MSLYLKETGTPGAPSIVFLHGIGTSGWMWGRQVAALIDFHCLTVDFPGHGKSNQVEWRSLADTAHQIAAIIQTRATYRRAHIVGLSLGGYIALLLLERHASLIDHMIISGVTAEPMPNRALLQPQLWLTSTLMKRPWFVKMQARSLHLPPDEQAAVKEDLLAMSMQAYRRIWQEAVDFRLSPALRHIINPTLAVAGGNEAKIITQAVNAITELLPHAQGALAPALGHGWNVEAPALFNAMVRAWITDRPLPAQLQVIQGIGSKSHR